MTPESNSPKQGCDPVQYLKPVTCHLLSNYGAVVAEDLDGVRVGVEDAHLHGRRGEQEPEDATLEVARLRRLDPTNLRVLQVSIGGDEPLQQEAQGDPEGESEDDAAEDHEVEVAAA